MKSFAASIVIRAPVERIWSLLTDAERYPMWNSTVERISGRIAPGEKIAVYTKMTPGRAFPVSVTEFAVNRRMVWSGGLPLGLFAGQRIFTLQQMTDGCVEFAMREEFRGPLAGLMARSIPDLQAAFDAFAADLKRQAETP
jgi:hypothetical protein